MKPNSPKVAAQPINLELAVAILTDKDIYPNNFYVCPSVPVDYMVEPWVHRRFPFNLAKGVCISLASSFSNCFGLVFSGRLFHTQIAQFRRVTHAKRFCKNQTQERTI